MCCFFSNRKIAATIVRSNMQPRPASHPLVAVVCVLSSFNSFTAAGIVVIPPQMMGVWEGNVTHSPLGPHDIGGPYMSISEPDAHGNVYMRHPKEAQLFRVSGSVAQYCFAYDTPNRPVTGADTAPFELHHHDNKSLMFCWRGPRLPSHRSNCTGCDCAQWTLTLNGLSPSLKGVASL